MLIELNKIHNMDVVEGIDLVDNESIDTTITSPPYWACRDYGIPKTKWPEIIFRPNILYDFTVTVPAMECCLGLEEDPIHFIGHMVYVFRKIRPKMKKTGTLWLNIGDTYSQPNYGQGGSRIKEDRKYKNCPTLRRFDAPDFKSRVPNKNLMGIPWAIAEALKADRWFLRMDIIWHKPNPMPESAKDRPTKAHEYIFLLSRSKTYYYNAKAIEEPMTSSSIIRLNQDIDQQIGSARANGCQKSNGNMKAVGGSKGAFGTEQSRTRAKGNRKTFRGGGLYTENKVFYADSIIENDAPGNKPNETMMKNKRSVWTILEDEFIQFLQWKEANNTDKKSVWTVASQPVKFAHFATYPPKLIEPCILAGCPVGGIVLEPFSGSGTTMREAIANNRNCIAFELKPEYIQMSEDHRLNSIQIKMNLEG